MPYDVNSDRVTDYIESNLQSDVHVARQILGFDRARFEKGRLRQTSSARGKGPGKRAGKYQREAGYYHSNIKCMVLQVTMHACMHNYKKIAIARNQFYL